MKPLYFLFCLSLLLISCGHNEQKKQIKKKEFIPPIKNITTVPQHDTSELSIDTLISNIDTTSLPSINSKQKEKNLSKNVDNLKSNEKTSKPTETLPNHFEAFVHFRQMLAATKNGTTITQKELNQYNQIPKDVIKMIKSITKINDNEIAVKWHSTWFVEQLSDAKFTDANMKFRFDKNKMYTSGKAIGIKYNQKMYTDLIIIGNSAYIPSVKGFHWQIGK